MARSIYNIIRENPIEFRRTLRKYDNDMQFADWQKKIAVNAIVYTRKTSKKSMKTRIFFCKTIDLGGRCCKISM